MTDCLLLTTLNRDMKNSCTANQTNSQHVWNQKNSSPTPHPSPKALKEDKGKPKRKKKTTAKSSQYQTHMAARPNLSICKEVDSHYDRLSPTYNSQQGHEKLMYSKSDQLSKCVESKNSSPSLHPSLFSP